ncbi:hypothetical protein F9C07_2263730 [Aspergillus flavus]|uniref:DNA2/NAM7 helicase-like C-terminal domain-containing protein n=2 Tax=Aspergillus flavus TaxID=5059 RepID=A0A7U2R215_ASPFN|nr:uncharacterized protein G4B84_012009 [Aspergillus flavus NRRL3357]QMW48535.1 hypothetical protein G4B11_012053 [Aspergillus flavus]KAF7626485.1 hypothetical protein AFLA_013876 [Aspergillus flavus NRRL3357]QMW36480.1 hypothetical protein G4B84_012009 [Aspergillus flavus NRRL3357]QRD92487.1 hypothetical protein F9C07_2263730 [Aspergillus flavus]RAQ57536.1 hypothetical protein COH21_010063 [Aspergillus flavus]
MIDDPSVASINLSNEVADVLLEWIRTTPPGAKFENGLELIGLNVSNDQTMVNNWNHSRSKAANVSVVMDLVEFLINPNVLSNVTCSIITTYSEQKKCYIAKMPELSVKLNIVFEDWVVDSGSKSDLGFASYNSRANVAITRARACLIVVANGRILDNDRLILVHWQYLLNNDLIVDCPGELPTVDSNVEKEKKSAGPTNL